MIDIKDVSKKYNNFFALNKVSLRIEEGKSYCIVGESGCGKTTLLKIIGGILEPTSGVVTFKGEDLYKMNYKQLATFRNQNVGFIFQNFFLDENFTIFENIIIPLLIRGKLSKNAMDEKAKEVLKIVGLLDKRDQICKTLSGGEKQRVAIARALIGNPDYILADEPTGNLDSKNSDNIINLLLGLTQLGKTVIVITHSDIVSKKINNKFFLSDGKLIESDYCD